MKKCLCFSRYAHRFEGAEYVCYMNALRMRPIYLEKDSAGPLDVLFAQGPHKFFDAKALANRNRGYSQLLAELENEKVLSSTLQMDSVIDVIRDRITKPYPSVMYMILSEQCNLKCSYCFINSSFREGCRSPSGLMSRKTCIKALDFYSMLIKQDMQLFNEQKIIIFYGGEPLINLEGLEHSLNLIEAYRREGGLPDDTKTSIVTNGTLLSNHAIGLLKKHKVSASISIDGANAEQNEARRFKNGRPAFNRIMKAVEQLKYSGINFGLSVTITEQALEDQKGLLSALEQLGVKNIGINPITPAYDERGSLQYSRKIADFIIEFHKKLAPKGFKEDRMSRNIRAFGQAELMYWDCAGAGANQVVVAPNGQVGICHGVLGERLDFPTNIEDRAFSPRDDATCAKWSEFTPLKRPECQNCEAIGICGGGCPLRAYRKSGEWGSVDRQFCIHSRKTLRYMISELWKCTMEGKRERFSQEKLNESK